VRASAWAAIGVAAALVVAVALVVALSGSADPVAPPQDEGSKPRVRPALGGPRVLDGAGPRDDPTPVPAELERTVRRVRRELGDAPQSGLVLGSANAPVSITEYGDPRCRECALIHRDVIPEVIRRYVATGKASLSFRPWPLYGRRSERLVRSALSASRQGRFWEFLQVAFLRGTRSNANDGPGAWAAALGLDVPRWRRDLGLPRWRREMEATVSVAEAVHLPVMPVFLLRSSRRGPLTVLTEPRSVDDFLLAIAASSDDLQETPRAGV
jgi:Thioredoxin